MNDEENTGMSGLVLPKELETNRKIHFFNAQKRIFVGSADTADK